jgi:hypothetical protein
LGTIVEVSRSESDPLEPSKCVSKASALLLENRAERSPKQSRRRYPDERKRSSLALVPRIVLVVVLIVGPKLFIEPGTKAFFPLSSVSGPGL